MPVDRASRHSPWLVLGAEVDDGDFVEDGSEALAESLVRRCDEAGVAVFVRGEASRISRWIGLSGIRRPKSLRQRRTYLRKYVP